MKLLKISAVAMALLFVQTTFAEGSGQPPCALQAKVGRHAATTVATPIKIVSSVSNSATGVK